MKLPKHLELLKQVSGHYEVKGTNLLVPGFNLFDFMNDMLNEDHTITVYPVMLRRNHRLSQATKKSRNDGEKRKKGRKKHIYRWKREAKGKVPKKALAMTPTAYYAKKFPHLVLVYKK